MNRYQREVAEMDRRHRLIVRGASFTAATALAVAALWSAGLLPTQWRVRLQAWWAETHKPDESLAIAPPALAAPSDGSPTSGEVAATLQPGTESSIAAEPQPLFLAGTSPGRNKNEGTALIGVNPDNPQTYVGGAMLANGARLVEIHPDHVVLARGASFAKLPLYQRNAPLPQTRSVLLMVGGEAASAPAAATSVQNVLTEYLRPSPLYEGEVLRGYEIYPGRKAGVFARLGLQAGDVITAINGLPLSEPRQAMELFAELTRGGAVTATIERRNKVQSIALDGALILSDQDATQSSAAQTALPFGAPAG